MSTNYEDRALALLRVAVPEAVIENFRPAREFRFSPPRLWRFDMAWPDERVALEVDGGQYVFGGGRHNSDADRDKMNSAAALGWRVLRVSPSMLKHAEQVLRNADGDGFVEFREVDWLQLNKKALWLVSLRVALDYHIPGPPTRR
jgi:hypothetical protein